MMKNAFGKVKFAVVCTLLIRELGMGLVAGKG